ncbi:MAG: hypothetical protein JXQ96_16510 [Cyclobacteriaceae bacterium]
MKDLDIKKIWDEGSEAESTELDAHEVQKILEKGSISIISKFINSLRFEMWLNLVILTLFCGYLLANRNWLIAFFFLIVDAIYFFYYKNLIRKLSETKVDKSVIIYLQLVYSMINRFIAHYKVANLVLAVPLFLAAVYIVDPKLFTDKYATDGWFIVYTASCFTLAIVLMYLFLYFVYGKKAKKIKALILDLTKD